MRYTMAKSKNKIIERLLKNNQITLEEVTILLKGDKVYNVTNITNGLPGIKWTSNRSNETSNETSDENQINS